MAYLRDRYGTGAVPAWSVGNEQWNIIEPNGCVNRPAKYVDRYHRFARAMRGADPHIQLVASGGDAFTLPRWNEEIIRGIGPAMDFLSMHLYLPGWIPLRSHVGRSAGAYYAIAAAGMFLEEQVVLVEETAQRLIGRPLPIALDEWNILGPLSRFTDPYRSLREAIGVAGILHAFHRQARHVKTAAMFAMINSAAPPILSTRDSLVRTPIHHVLKMYRQLTGKSSVRTVTECPVVDTPALLNLPARKAVPLLDVSATRDDGRLTVFVINRDAEEHHAARIDVSGFHCSGRARVHGIAADGYSAENTVDDPGAVAEHVREMEWKGFLRFPPCSVTAIVLES